MTTTISPSTLMQKATNPAQGDNQTSKTDFNPDSLDIKESEKVYQFSMCPCTYRFAHSRIRKTMPDGTYRTSDPEDMSELDAKVKRGLLREIKANGDIIHKGFTIPVGPKTPVEVDEG